MDTNTPRNVQDKNGTKKVKATCKKCHESFIGTKDELEEIARGHAKVHAFFNVLLEELMDPEEYYEDPMEFERD